MTVEPISAPICASPVHRGAIASPMRKPAPAPEITARNSIFNNFFLITRVDIIATMIGTKIGTDTRKGGSKGRLSPPALPNLVQVAFGDILALLATQEHQAVQEVLRQVDLL